MHRLQTFFKRFSIIGAFVILVISAWSIISDSNRKNEIKEVIPFGLPSYRITRALSNGDIWDYTTCYVIEFSSPLTQENIREFLNHMTEIQKNYSFTFTLIYNERDDAHRQRIKRYFGCAGHTEQRSEVLYKSDLNYYGEIKDQLNPEKFIKFGFNTSSNCAVIKIMHM